MKMIFGILGIAFTPCCFGQPGQYIISDSHDKSPIPFATVKVLHSNRGAVADHEGVLVLKVEPGDTLLISSAGYQSKKMAGIPVSPVFYLERRVDYLPGITVRQTIPVRTVILGNGAAYLDDNLKCDWNGEKSPGCLPLRSNNLEEEFAEEIILPDSSHVYKIRKLYIPVKKTRGIDTLLLRIYAADSSTGLPGDELFARLVVLTSRNVKKHKVQIDLENENWLVSNSRHFFISVGWAPHYSFTGGYLLFPFYKTESVNTYQRSLLSSNYSWYLYNTMFASHRTYSTRYAVELEEKKYK